MFDFRKWLDIRRRIERYNAFIDSKPIPSAEEIPFWLCEDDVFHHVFDGITDKDGDNALLIL